MLPSHKSFDERIRKRFEDLIKAGESLPTMNTLGRPAYSAFRTGVESLMHLLLDAARCEHFWQQFMLWEGHLVAPERILGTLKGLKEDYESGILDDLSQTIETNVTYDYMSQAEQLLGGKRHQYDHVPAAVLAGAVLEDALRRLCQRQSPPIPTEKNNGDPKTLDPLITDLQKINLFNKAKADQLRSWAKIRNAAAHGEFTEFDRSQVDEMIPGIKNFLADYL